MWFLRMGGEALHGLPRDAVSAPSLQTSEARLDEALSAVGVAVRCGGVGQNDRYRPLPTPTVPRLNSEQALSAAASCSAQRQPGCDRDVAVPGLPVVRGCAASRSDGRPQRSLWQQQCSSRPCLGQQAWLS